MAVRLQKSTKLVYVDLSDVEDSEEEVVTIRHPSPQPRSKPKENFKNWLVQKTIKKSFKSGIKWDFFYLVIFIFFVATAGLALALKDGQNEAMNTGLLVMAFVLALVLVFVTMVQCRRSCCKKQEIKVSRVFNQTNADGYIDIDY